jgi:cytochrome c-type biogenesis protein CcsB
MSEALKSLNVSVASQIELKRPAVLNYLPALLPLMGAAVMVTARIQMGQANFISDGALITLALLCYITSASLHLTNLYAPIKSLHMLGIWTASLGFFFNLSSWLVRWVTAGDRENWVRLIDLEGVRHSWWVFSYIPFANLYDLSIAFAFGAAFATLLVEHRPSARVVGGLSLTLISLVLMLAIFIGNDFINLPPILDSYWRPIHVGVASISYGVALVSFAIAVMYLLKDGVKPESMGIFVTLCVLAGFVLFSNSFGLSGMFSFSYKLNPVLASERGVMAIKPLRVEVPGVGPWLTISLLLLAVVAVCFLLYVFKHNEKARRYGHLALRVSLLTQAIGIAWLFYQIKTLRGVGANVDASQYRAVGEWMAGDQASQLQVSQLVQAAQNWLAQNGSSMIFHVQSNPVELASLITALVATLFIVLFSFRTERLLASLPAKEKLDNLIYKCVGVAFAGLAILLVTGAVWANESWGRYWAWDPKETGALVAWLAYAGYLHTRIAHGWSGRRSAYFALLGFLLVIFTYLGVSYLLPGLHSYA